MLNPHLTRTTVGYDHYRRLPNWLLRKTTENHPKAFEKQLDGVSGTTEFIHILAQYSFTRYQHDTVILLLVPRSMPGVVNL